MFDFPAGVSNVSWRILSQLELLSLMITIDVSIMINLELFSTDTKNVHGCEYIQNEEGESNNKNKTLD